MRCKHFGYFVLAAAVMLAGSATAQTWPDSMAALGDSITRGVFADDSISGLEDGQPEHSWSTGYDSGDSVYSHYERILANNGGISGNNNNLAVSGADMDNLLGQANNAVAAGVDYVTIEMGANDVCKGSADDMTPVATFQSEFQSGIDALQAGLPDAVILVCETVNVGRVWDVGSGNFWCQIKWNIFSFCESMLTNGSTERALARARNVEYNNVLRSVCATEGIAFNDDVYEYAFARGDLSNVDCFHPASSAHAAVAALTFDSSIF